jgi:hypothetical protein
VLPVVIVFTALRYRVPLSTTFGISLVLAATVLAGSASLVAGSVAFGSSWRALGSLRIVGGVLWWNGEVLGTIADLRDYVAYTTRTHAGVRLRFDARFVHVEFDSRHDAERALDALDAGRSTPALELTPGTGPLLSAASIMASQAIFFAWFGVASNLLVLLPITLFVASRVRWTIGADGILIRIGIRGRRYVPYSQITSVKVDNHHVRIVARDRWTGTFRGVNDHSAVSRPVIGLNAIAAHIQRARDRASRGAAADEVTTRLARSDRDASTWLYALQQIQTDATSFREAPVSRERLWRLLEDASQPADVRGAAAIALRANLDEPERARLRVMTASCASPRLRVAFEAAQGEDDARLAKARGGLEGDEPAQQGRARRVALTGSRVALSVRVRHA